MKAHLLFPRYFRPIGFLLAIPGLVLGYLFLFHKYRIPGFGPEPKPNNMVGMFYTYTNELALALVIIGLLFIAFSKLKTEDELTAYIRLNSLYWAILIHYIVLVGVYISYSLTNGYSESFDGFIILHVSLILPLVIFTLRFYYLLNKNKDEYYAPPLHFLPYKPFNKTGRTLSIICIIIVIARIISLWNVPDGLRITEPSVWDYFEHVYEIAPFIFLMWVYSKEQREDEYINMIRLHAMQTAIYVNYAILLLANFFIFGLTFLSVETDNLSTIPLIFIIVFQYRLYKLSKNSDERSNSKITLNTL